MVLPATAAEANALRLVERTDDPAALRTILRNAAGRSEPVERAALVKLVQLEGDDETDPVARICWTMVRTIEELRRRNGRSVWKMNRLRPKIAREGAHAALAYCAWNHTDGFDEVIAYGLPEWTAEAIVLSMPDDFPAADLRARAAARLRDAGIDPSRFGPAGG